MGDTRIQMPHPVRQRLAPASLVLLLLCVVWLAAPSRDARGAEGTADPKQLIEGRTVYLREACWQCHSGGVPGAPEPKGSRRTGPDLVRQARERSRAWQYAHLYDPRALDPHSAMAPYGSLFRVHPKDELAREFIRAYDSKDGGRDQDGIVTRAEFERAGGTKWSGKLKLLDTKTLDVAIPGKPGEVRREGDGVVSMNDATPVISADLESLTVYLDSLGAGQAPGEVHEAATEIPNRSKTTPEERRDAVGRGRKLYLQHCAGCHGVHADGNGPVARFFDLRPRNFLRGEYKFRSTVTPDPPTDRDLFRTIRRGAGLSMPAWPHLADAQVWDLVEYLKSNHPYYIPTELTVEDRFGATRVAFLRWTQEQQAEKRLEGAQPADASGFQIGNGRLQKRHGRWFWIQGGAPREVTDGLQVVTVLEGVQVTPVLRLGKPVYDWMEDYDPHVRTVLLGEAPIPYTRESAALGKQVYAELGCATCHGAEGRGDGPGLESSRGSLGQLLLPADFAHPEASIKGGSDDISLVRSFLTGLTGTPMPSYSGNFQASLVASPEKAPWHLAHYIQSLAGLSPAE